MAEKELKNLPPVYSNLGFDSESEAGPSAPNIPASTSSSTGADFQPQQTHPTAPLPESPLGPPPLYYSPPSLVFEDIYDACVKYVKDNCCYGSRFINRMKLTEISNKEVFHYRLESFGEKRESADRTTPYRGGPVDGPENGPAPSPWDMPVRCPALFVNATVKTDIPHTATVHTCTRCDGSGKVTCSSCFGSGRTNCWSCGGSGRDSEDDRCSSCSGSGSETCSSCFGSGKEECSRCDGYGKLKKYKILIVTWKNHPSNFLTATDSMPSKLILEAGGTDLLQQEETALLPVSNAPVGTVNDASARLLEHHGTSFPSEMIIRQKHVLRGVPFTQVKYQWKEKEGEFYVYGTERKVYFEDYPQKCCCCTCC